MTSLVAGLWMSIHLSLLDSINFPSMKSFTVGTEDEEKEDAGCQLEFTLEETWRIRARNAAAAAATAATAAAAGERSRGQAGPHRSPVSARAPPEPCARALRPRNARQVAARGLGASALGGGGGRIAPRLEAGPAARPQPDLHRHLPERPGGPSAPRARAPPPPPPRGA